MLTGTTYFRGNSMNRTDAEHLVRGLSELAGLAPDRWNIVEPIDRKMHPLQDIINTLSPPSTKVGVLVFFARSTWPRYWLSIDLRLGPVQWTTPHNQISYTFEDSWPGGEQILANYLSRFIHPKYPDYASIPDWSQDSARYIEFRRSYSPEEFKKLFARKREITAPFGPYGCLADVHWFNYFGKVYVEAIGRSRLMAAGWTRVEEIGEGLACYATDKIDDSNSRERRNSIAKVIEEFIWTPGCKPDQKRILDFDFSEQFAALPDDIATKLYDPLHRGK